MGVPEKGRVSVHRWSLLFLLRVRGLRTSGARSMGGLAFLHIVTIPLGDLNGVGAGFLNHGLAAKARVELNIGRSLHAIEFQVFRITNAGFALFNPDMAGSARTDSTASMVEEDIIVFGDVEKGHGESVTLIGEGVKGELDGAALGLKGDANHALGCWLGEVDGSTRLGVIGHIIRFYRLAAGPEESVTDRR